MPVVPIFNRLKIALFEHGDGDVVIIEPELDAVGPTVGPKLDEVPTQIIAFCRLKRYDQVVGPDWPPAMKVELVLKKYCEGRAKMIADPGSDSLLKHA